MTAQPKVAELEGSQPIVGEKTVNLALQGGGSHGAFTWGVLDRLLEDERIGFDHVNATICWDSERIAGCRPVRPSESGVGARCMPP